MNVQDALRSLDLLEQRLALIEAVRSWVSDNRDIFYGASDMVVSPEVKIRLDGELEALSAQTQVSIDNLLESEVSNDQD